MNPARRRIKDKLSRRDIVIGINPEYPSPSLVEFLGRNGFDLVFIDCEQGGPDVETVVEMTRAARAAGIVSVLRPWSKEPGLVRRFLSCGIDGLIVPDTETVADVQSVRDIIAASAPPGADDMLVIPLIESKTGVANAVGILQAEGVDAIQVGPGDLAVSLGLSRRGDHPQIRAMAFDVFNQARTLGKSAGGPVNRYGADAVISAGGNIPMFFLNDLLRQGIDIALPARPKSSE